MALGPDCGGALHVGQAVAVTTCSSFSEYCVAKAAMCTPLEGRWVGRWTVDVRPLIGQQALRTLMCSPLVGGQALRKLICRPLVGGQALRTLMCRLLVGGQALRTLMGRPLVAGLVGKGLREGCVRDCNTKQLAAGTETGT